MNFVLKVNLPYNRETKTRETLSWDDATEAQIRSAEEITVQLEGRARADAAVFRAEAERVLQALDQALPGHGFRGLREFGHSVWMGGHQFPDPKGQVLGVAVTRESTVASCADAVLRKFAK